MATQPQTQGQLQDFLAILKRRAWQIVIPCALGVAVGSFMVSVMPRSYTVQTQLEVHEMTPPLGGRGFEATSIAREVVNVGPMIKAPERVRSVIEKQEWQDYAGLSREEQSIYLQKLIARVQVPPPVVSKTQQGSQFIRIQYSDSEPQRAAQFLNDLREAYVREMVTRGRERAREDREDLQEQRKQKEMAFQEAQRQLTELNKRYKLSVTQPAPGTSRERAEDPLETLLRNTEARLNDARQQLKVETAKNAQLREAYEKEPEEVPVREVSPGVSVDDRVASIDDQIAKINQVIADKGLLPANTEYQRSQDTIRGLEEQKKQILGRSTASTVETRYEKNKKRQQLYDALEASSFQISSAEATVKTLEANVKELGAKLLELADVYRELNALTIERDNAAVAYSNADDAYQRQKAFYEYISGPPGNPFEVIERAEPPRDPSSPIVPLVITMYAVIGLGLGLASAVLAEFGRNAFRSVGDVARSMSIPVLGAVGEIVTRAELRNRTVRRGAVGLASLTLIGSILWVTWAFTNRQDLLSADLREAIHALQEKLR